MANLEWRGPFSYLKATGASMTLTSGYPAYTFVNTGQPESGYMGQWIKSDWFEPSGQVQFDRLLGFNFVPRYSDGSNPLQDAINNGWTLYGVDSRDNQNIDMWWRESFMNYDLRPTTIATTTSRQLFSCQSFTATFYDKEFGQVRGKFTASDILLGGFFETSSYDPSAMPKYNPCDTFNGQPCRAEDGVIYCGSVLYDPNRPDPPITLNWQGPKSFLEVYNALAVPYFSVPYDFRDYLDRPPTYVSDTFGGLIGWSDWQESHGNVIYDRGLRFYFQPLVGGTAGTEEQRARDGGYRIYKVEMKGSGGGWVKWENANSNMVVPRGGPSTSFQSFDYYSCEKIEFGLTDRSTFTGEYSTIGGYLPSQYSLGELVGYNPCFEMGLPGPCNAKNGVVFCNNVIVPSPDPGPGPSPRPTAAPARDGSGIDIDWRLDRAYLYGEDVEAVVTQGQPPQYTFEEEPGTESESTGTDGTELEREWSEVGVSHRRGLFFKTYPAKSGNADSLQEVKMRDNLDNWIWWKDPSGQFYQQDNMIVIPAFYDGFYCQRALFTFRNPNGGNAQGAFLAHDFTFANQLYPNYDPAYLRWFNPCEHIRYGSKAEYGCENGKTCTCSVEDSVVSCNGKAVSYGEIYADMAITVKSEGVGGVESESAAGPAGGRAPGSPFALVGALVAVVAVHWGVLS